MDKMTQKIRTIMCCCGNGVGTSLIMQMTVEEALHNLGIKGINVTFGPLSDISAGRADLFVVSQELLKTMGVLPAIGLTDLMDSDMAAEQLRKVLKIG